jgi:hypothetical protein
MQTRKKLIHLEKEWDVIILVQNGKHDIGRVRLGNESVI